MEVNNAVDYEWFQTFRESLRMYSVRFRIPLGKGIDLIPLNFSFSIILKATVTLESTLHDFAKFLGKLFVIEEMVDSKTRTRRFAGVSWTDAFLSSSDTAASEKTSQWKDSENTSTRPALLL